MCSMARAEDEERQRGAPAVAETGTAKDPAAGPEATRRLRRAVARRCCMAMMRQTE